MKLLCASWPTHTSGNKSRLQELDKFGDEENRKKSFQQTGAREGGNHGWIHPVRIQRGCPDVVFSISSSLQAILAIRRPVTFVAEDARSA